MFEDKFEQLLSNYADAITDKKRFSGLLKDFFPDNPMQVNLINTVYALGIVQDLNIVSSINNSFAFRYVKQMIDEYGISRLYADWAVSAWCVCYGKNVLHKPCDIEISQAKSGQMPAITEERPDDGNKQYADLFRYTKVDDGLGVIGFNGRNKKTIIFSDRYSGLPVKRIMPDAFAECEVQEVVMSGGISAIDNSAFKDCKDLKQVIFPITLKEIGDNAFYGCEKLITASLPAATEQIGRHAFADTALKNITIPKSVYWIGEGAYANCKRLNNIVIPENIISIADSTFKGCEGLRKIELSESVASIGNNAFEGCTSLEMLIIPEAVKHIGENAFANVNPDFTLLCRRQSVTEQYAREHNIKFINQF